MMLDIDFIVIVVLVVNFSDYLFKHIFDGYQARDTTVFIYNHRHVAAILTKFLEQYVQTFTFRNE